MKVYIDATTNELIVEDQDITVTAGYPAFLELSRSKDERSGRVTIESIHGGVVALRNVHFADAEDESGTPYGTLDNLWDALTPYFTI